METPLLALNFPESDSAAPSSMLATSLSLEAEAQRVATLALSEFIGMRRTDTRPRIAVISRPGALERRIAQAYVSAARAEGDVPVQVEWTAETAPRVAALLAEPSLEAVFLALTARDAAQLRAIIPRDLPVFGTSLLYAGDPVSSPESATLAHDLEGIRFLEMPWLLQPEHPAVMIYPPPAADWPLELRRLYAFGIDAYRLAIVMDEGRPPLRTRRRDRPPAGRPRAVAARAAHAVAGGLSQRRARAHRPRSLMKLPARLRSPVGGVRTPKQRAGDKAEQAAEQHLVRHGCTIVARNARYREGELDLIARERDVLVFVEVRMRSGKCLRRRGCQRRPLQAATARARRAALAAAELRRALARVPLRRHHGGSGWHNRLDPRCFRGIGVFEQ